MYNDLEQGLTKIGMNNLLFIYLHLSKSIKKNWLKCIFNIVIFYSELTFRVKCSRIKFKLVKDYSANGKIRNTLPTIFERNRYFSRSIFKR